MTRLNILISCVLIMLLTSCIKPYIDYDDFEWIYYDKKSTRLGKYILEGSNCEYLILIDKSLINITSQCNERCNVINELGEVVDTCTYLDPSRLNRMQRIDTLKKFIWRYNIRMIDTTLISNVEYVSIPVGSLNLLTRKMPEREQRINFQMDGEDYSFVLRDVRKVKEIYQYDSKLFLISMEDVNINISPGRLNEYVVMLDLEKMSKRRLFGFILE